MLKTSFPHMTSSSNAHHRHPNITSTTTSTFLDTAKKLEQLERRFVEPIKMTTTSATNNNNHNNMSTSPPAALSNSCLSTTSTTGGSSSNQTLMTSHLQPKVEGRSSLLPTNTTPTNKRKSTLPVKRPPVVPPPSSSRGHKRNRISINATANATDDSPTNHNHQHHKPRKLHHHTTHNAAATTNHSAPPPPPSIPNHSSSTTKSPPANSTHTNIHSSNTRITSFFVSNAASHNQNQSHLKKTNSVTPTPSPSSSNHHYSEELGRLQAQIKALEKQVEIKDKLLEDTTAQLKAVNNSRTIYQSQLNSALQQRDTELSQLSLKYQTLQVQSQSVIETMARNEAARQARDLRQTLASDGARLGRLVYSRVSNTHHYSIMPHQSLETWEDGELAKSIQQQKQQLQKQKRQLQEQTNNPHQDKDNHSDLLDSLEIKYARKRKLRALLQQEQELALKEQQLSLEKGAHIRSLKRVASEDASRFNSRPKLHDRYVLLSLLGRGGFSEVWKAYDLVDLKEVAVKIHQLDERWSEGKKENYTKHVSREYEIHRHVRHSRIVSLFDVFEIDNNSFATVLECCNGTDLDTLLKDKRTIPEQDAHAILLQILSGMRYLSSPSEDGSRQGIIHYDLKPGNILLDENGDAKITDFGLSKIVDAEESMELTSQGAGTYWYLPPECFITDQNVRISNKVDVWSIGIIYYQMLFGKRPFGDGQSQDKVLSNHVMLNARNVRFPDSPTVSDGAKQFIRQCLTYDQTFRPSISQLCLLPYVVE